MQQRNRAGTVTTRSISGVEPLEVDSLAERAYSLRFIDLRAALELGCSALEQAERVGCPRQIGRALVALGAIRCRRMELDQAAADLERAWKIFETHADPVGRARVLCWQGSVEFRRADYPKSMQLATEALSHFLTAGDRQGEGDVLHKIGLLLYFMGEFAAALEALEESRQIKEELGDQHGLALCTSDSAGAFFEMGEYKSARQSFEEAIAYYRRTGATSALLANLINHGLTCGELGDYEAALASLNECISLSREKGEQWAEARAVWNLGELHYMMGDLQSAMAHLTEAEEFSRAIGDRLMEIGVLESTGRILLRLGDPERALEKVTRALSAAETGRLHKQTVEAHEVLAEAYEAVGDLPAAVRHLRAFHELREQVQCAGAELRTQYRREIAKLRRAQQETELQVLKAQLQPHFLFNALHSVSALIELNPSDATKAVTQLGDLLRLALVQSSVQLVTLDAEIEFVCAYLKLEQVRYRDAFTYTVHLEPGLQDVRVPHLLLQPLAENAIRHGLVRAEGAVGLEIRAERASRDRLRLSVLDTGVGLPVGWSLEAATGVGLRNTRSRLRRLYGSEHEFHIEPAPTGGTRVEIILPIGSG